MEHKSSYQLVTCTLPDGEQNCIPHSHQRKRSLLEKIEDTPKRFVVKVGYFITIFDARNRDPNETQVPSLSLKLDSNRRKCCYPFDVIRSTKRNFHETRLLTLKNTILISTKTTIARKYLELENKVLSFSMTSGRQYL